MKRRFSTRDVGLTARMIAVAIGVLGLAAAVIAGVVGLCVLEPGWTPYAVVVTAVIVFTTAGKYGTATGLMLDAVGAERSTSDDEPALHTMIERLSALADLPAPRLAIVESPVANAFTSGVRRRNATVVLTTGLPSELEPHELEAVLAHELAHVANRDAGVMTLASVPRTLGETMIVEEGLVFYVWFFVWWFGIPIWALGSLLTLALSRYREFAADRGSAILTGRPEALMSALVKLAGPGAAIPDADLRRLSRVEALWVVPNGKARFAIFSDHPPLERRLARLEAMAREMGRPVGP